MAHVQFETLCGRAGRPQTMVNVDGTAKGLRTILAEREINTVRMKADDMRTVLSNHDDFVNEKTNVQHYVEGHGHVTLSSYLSSIAN